ncbi:MAG: radical SAM protein [Nannocystaceae bacterium]
MSRESSSPWADLHYQTCSVLPVRMACNCACKFCFSRSSISALTRERVGWGSLDVDAYYRYAISRGAKRLVITGGGEPLLRPDDVVMLVDRGRRHFDEIALFTNGTHLTKQLAARLRRAGLSYLCWSRHHVSDEANAQLMGPSAPTRDSFFAQVGTLPVRATCVMARGHIEHDEDVWRYIDTLVEHGVREFTFKHTYVAYPNSVFRGSLADRWSRAHQLERDPFEHVGTIVDTLPWGPAIRRVVRRGQDCQICHYREPTPQWELQNKIGRSLNLLSDGTVYGSLEDARSLLFRLSSSSPPLAPSKSSRFDPCFPSVTEPEPKPIAKRLPKSMIDH